MKLKTGCASESRKLNKVENYLVILKNEFDAEDNSFLIQLRCDFRWDRIAFSRLVDSMKACCENNAESGNLERWLAAGFWYLQDFVKEHTSHQDFYKPYSQNYYEWAYKRLDDLAYWFFLGESPYIENKGFEPFEESSTALNLLESDLGKQNE